MKTCKWNLCEVSKQMQMVCAHPGLFKWLKFCCSPGLGPFIVHYSNRFIYSYICNTKNLVRDQLLPVSNSFAVHLVMSELKTKLALQPVGLWLQVQFHQLQSGSVSVFFWSVWPDLQALRLAGGTNLKGENVGGQKGVFQSVAVPVDVMSHVVTHP